MEVDPVTVEGLYIEYAPGLRRFVAGVLRDAVAAEDVVQAVFVKASCELESVHSGAVKSWLYRVAFHEAINVKRRAGLDRKATQRLQDEPFQQSLDTPDEGLVRKETIEQVRQAMTGLSPSQQKVIQARVYDQKTFAQIAATMRLPLGTVLSHMRRGLEQLRRSLQE